MHNWHLPLLAFLAFVHPIVCFSEHSLVDGREQRCYSNNLLRDKRLPYGTVCFQKSEDNRLNNRPEIRKDRRYEVKRDVSELTRFANRRLGDLRSESEASRNSREVADRLSRSGNQQVRLLNVLRQRSLSTLELGVRQFSPAIRRTVSKEIDRDQRLQDIVRQRESRGFQTRLYERDNREHRLSTVNSNRMVRNSGDETRHTTPYDSWRDSQRIRVREVVNEFRGIRSRETRDLIHRTRSDIGHSEISRERREIRERMDERRVFSLRPGSRLQRDTMREHRSLEREVPDSRDTRLPSLASRSADRIRSIRDETSSRLREVRNERQRVDSRVLAERISDRRQSHLSNREVRDKSEREHRHKTTTIHLDSRERMSEERRPNRNSVDRVRNIDNRDMRLERVANRRDSRTYERVARVYNRDNRVASENRLESSTMNQEIRQDENILSRKDRRSSDRMEIRDMKRATRSGSTEVRERDTTRIEQRMTKNMERGDMDSRFRTNEFRRVRENLASTIREKTQFTEQSIVLNWQYLFYTLQGVYLCSLLIQMSDNGSKKKSR